MRNAGDAPRYVKIHDAGVRPVRKTKDHCPVTAGDPSWFRKARALLYEPPMKLAIAVVLGIAGTASAQPGMMDPDPAVSPPGLTPAVVPPAPPPPPAVVAPIDEASRRDAASDRAFGLGTAIVLPSGVSDASLRVGPFGALGSVAVGIGGGLEVSADYGSGHDQATMYGGGLKVSLGHGATWALALDGSIHKAGDNYGGSGATLYTFGGRVTTCIDAGCSALWSGGLGVYTSSDSSDKIPVLSTSLVLGRGGVKPLLELAYLAAPNAGGALGFAGLRLGGSHVAIDVGVGFVAAAGDSGGSAGVPMVGVALRP